MEDLDIERRTIEYGGKTHEDIPEELIRMAIAETRRGMNS